MAFINDTRKPIAKECLSVALHERILIVLDEQIVSLPRNVGFQKSALLDGSTSYRVGHNSSTVSMGLVFDECRFENHRVSIIQLHANSGGTGVIFMALRASEGHNTWASFVVLIDLSSITSSHLVFGFALPEMSQGGLRIDGASVRVFGFIVLELGGEGINCAALFIVHGTALIFRFVVVKV